MRTRSIRRILRSLRYRFFRYVGRTLFLGPPLVAVLIMLLLWWPAQMSGIYLGLFEGGPLLAALRSGLALSCLTLLGCLLYRWHVNLSTPEITEIYEEFPDPYFERNLTRVRNAKALTCAMLPFAGVLLGIGEAHRLADKTCANLTGALDALKWQARLGVDCQSALLMRFATLKLLAVAAVVVADAGLLLALLHRLERRTWARQTIAASAAVLALLTVIGPILAPANLTVTTAWLAGPAAAVLVVMTSGAAMLVGLSWVSHRIHVPITAALLALATIGAALGIKGNVFATGNAVGAGAPQTATHRNDRAELEVQFQKWLTKRRGSGDRRYPVFIFAAEGGGIYAASAIALFLTELQEENPNFARHIFAISAVSGGAVGSIIFQAVLNEPIVAGGGGERAAETKLSAVEHILLADHLSPVVALVLPDFFRKLLPIRENWNRATALERSLTCAFENRALAGDAFAPCSGDFTGNRLRQPFAAHWQDGASFALILNATWVETGFRVAFAPREMPLKGIGDSTLYGFADLPAPAVDGLSLVGAAVASARYPLIAPPWVVEHSGQGLWNFVDGGYADNSGSTTALEIYRALEDKAKELNADLYLVILTDAVAAPDPLNINGSGFSDTMAPVSALLNVRAQLASRAVTRAIDHFRPGDPGELVARSGDSRLLIARLEQRSVPLTLGWKISPTEIDLIRLMLGRPDCPTAPTPERAQDGAERGDIAVSTRTIIDNSCIKKRIVDVLAGAAEPVK